MEYDFALISYPWNIGKLCSPRSDVNPYNKILLLYIELSL